MRKISVSSWTANEEEYADGRAALMKRLDLAAYVDHPFVLCNRQKVGAMLFRIEMFKRVLGVKGSIVECGVHKGSSLMLYLHLSSVLEPYAVNRRIIGFDTFEGFASLSEKDSPRLAESDFSDTSFEVLAEMGRLSDLNRPLGHMSKLDIVKGDATEAIPAYVRDHPELIIAMLYLDFDIYEPTKVALDHLLPLVPKGGLVVIDEVTSAKWVGETMAVKERLRLNEIRLQKLPFEPMASFFEVG